MLQPPELASTAPLPWSVGRGVDAWEMFRAAIGGDVPALERLIRNDPALVRSMHEYRTALYFAVREMTRDRGFVGMDRLLTETLATRWNVSPEGETIAAAIRARDLPKVRALLDASPDLLTAADEGTNQPIHWAVMTRQIDVVSELL